MRAKRSVANSQWPFGSRVHFQGGDVLANRGSSDQIAVSPASRTAILFIHPEDDAKGALGTQAEFMQQRYSLERGHNAGAIVLRSLAHIPRIDVAADHNHFFRMYGSGDLAHHIAGLNIRLKMSIHLTAVQDSLNGLQRTLI